MAVSIFPEGRVVVVKDKLLHQKAVINLSFSNSECNRLKFVNKGLQIVKFVTKAVYVEVADQSISTVRSLIRGAEFERLVRLITSVFIFRGTLICVAG